MGSNSAKRVFFVPKRKLSVHIADPQYRGTMYATCPQPINGLSEMEVEDEARQIVEFFSDLLPVRIFCAVARRMSKEME